MRYALPVPKPPPNFDPLPQSVADALAHALASMPTPRRLQARRFPAPWHVEERGESFVVVDANQRPLAYLYFDDGDAARREDTKRMTREEARRIAAAVAKLPDLLRAERAQSG
jgi:hypothetical protein